MRTRVQKWGHSLALRIPKSFATEVHLEDNSVVELSLVEGKMVVAPVPAAPLTLERLLEGVTEENLHREIETGPPAGKEVW
jgi:antitoxin MazE